MYRILSILAEWDKVKRLIDDRWIVVRNPNAFASEHSNGGGFVRHDILRSIEEIQPFWCKIGVCV